MRIRTITTAAAVAALSTVGFAGTALAADDYVNDYEVPGHAQQQRQGKVVTHAMLEDYYDSDLDKTCDVVMNTVGDFDGDPYMNDGKMMNRYICEDGSVYTYIIFHESHPAYDADRLHGVWGSWGYMEHSNVR
jgi:hypothetical protein